MKNILNDYVSENTEIDSSTANLIDYLESYEEETINFNEYYSFYISNEDYQTFINYQKTDSSGDCGWYCIMGCGSDHGCCGNYSGCCIYWHIGCYIHDKQCTECQPPKYCLPGCVPDAEPVDESLTMY